MSSIFRRLAASALSFALIVPAVGAATAEASSFGSSSQTAAQTTENLASKEARLKKATESLLSRSGHTIDANAARFAELNLAFAKQGIFSYDRNAQYRDRTIDGTGFIIITRIPHNSIDRTIQNLDATPRVETGGPRLVGVAVGSDEQFTYLVEQYQY
ncbi:MAG: hypothetical protein Q4G50_13225 [Corynebacterium sp.]|uniref:hypothetical protein n=1 Tax=Corynebacterium sp. TaxID=1720 RepID=UPI0026DF83D2|nr:hypothetical protein [Corynebacterium sp.]MDO5670945.1 hypothetical protein [Corynebacterium sp.]